MKRFAIWLLFVVIVCGLFMIPTSAAQYGNSWTYERCWTNGCITDTLNRLTVEGANYAKLTTWNDSTYVWYNATYRPGGPR